MSEHQWTFFSNHAHVLVSLIGDPHQTLRDVADSVGITERAVQRIVSELEVAGIVGRHKEGRRNRYEFYLDQPMRHPLEAHITLEQVIGIIADTQAVS